jgi:hypothetical protein
MRIAIIVALSIAAAAQHMRIKGTLEPAAIPVSRPEQRRAVSKSPEVIFHELLNASPTAKAIALRELGIRVGDFGADSRIDDIRLARINLDDDEDREAVLTFTSGGKVTTAVVFDRSVGRWWQVGEFDYSWHWNSDDAERLIEFREIVWPGRKDLVVRTATGGTGVASTELAIYRLYRRLLYRVFQTTETAYDLTGEERRRISYEDLQGGRPIIVVKGITTTSQADNASSGSGKRKLASCNAYVWDPHNFTFQMSTTATARFCRAQ